MASSNSKARSSSPFRFSRPSFDKIPGFSPSPSSRSLTPRSNSPRLRFNSASTVDLCSPVLDAMDCPPARENISVTVRFRPLNPREIQRGDDCAWYPDGDTLVRSEYNPATAYAYDKVFGPATTTRAVYDVAARQVVRGAMEGINGTVFAYGVTSSGKTHTMHGDQKSPGIIPLAIKDVFNIIQDTAGQDFLLHVSYLEIYNEVINDLLDPTGQNLRVREDAQGTYVEGIKEEVVLSPAHALSLIAAGEEHRHVGSNNFNLLSSRSHTIFTLTVESSVQGDNFGEVNLSQLNLIDLAGSESSKTETTGIRRKEGSYINKSLLTLGTVISKLSESRPSHIPYRDSKLTRLLQSSLNGHGRVSLICTITPASSNMEETHNTLKFAHRAKRVELRAGPNRILDEKSLIKKYQKQIASLKQELEQFKRGILVPTTQEDLLTLKQKLEAGQVKMQSRLEEEEQAKAALMGRIQRLTKLILVSTKNTIPANIPERRCYRRRHSFGEDELAYLPDKRRDLISDNDDGLGFTGQDTDSSDNRKDVRNSADDILKDEKKTKRRGMLSWFKIRKQDSLHGSPVASPENGNSPNESPASAAFSMHLDLATEFKNANERSYNKMINGLQPVVDSYPEPTQAGELFCLTACRRKPPTTGTTLADQMDLLREQVKMIAGEIALCTSSLKRLSEQFANNPDDTQLQSQILKMEEEIEEKKQQMKLLKQKMIGIGEATANDASLSDLQEVIAKLTSQLNEKTFELEIMSADNRILQEQLQAKLAENDETQDAIALLRQQLASVLERSLYQGKDGDGFSIESTGSEVEMNADGRRHLTSKECCRGCAEEFQEQMLLQAVEIEKLKQDKVQLVEEKGGLQIQGQKLAEEASYAKELASAAAVELKNLAEEVTQLSFQKAKLAKELEATREMTFSRGPSKPDMGNGLHKYSESKPEQMKIMQKKRAIGDDEFENNIIDDIDSWNLDLEDMKMELHARKEREASLEAILAEKEQKEAELQNTINELRKKEADLENDLAGMWVLVADIKKGSEMHNNAKECIQNNNDDATLKPQGDAKETKEQEKDKEAIKELASHLDDEKRRGEELDRLVAQLKSEDLEGLELSALENLQSLHLEALTKLYEAKAQMQQQFGEESEYYSQGIINNKETMSHISEVSC